MDLILSGRYWLSFDAIHSRQLHLTPEVMQQAIMELQGKNPPNLSKTSALGQVFKVFL
jgi:hypothetical protein